MSSLLYVSNFLSAGKNRSYCEDLADRLEQQGANVIRTSTRQARLARLADMMKTAWTRRAEYRAAIIDLYSGAAFVWAEAVAWELRRLRKPYVITLHGGMLPVFARRWPARVRRLLSSAAAVTAPSDYLREQMLPYRSDIFVVRNAVDAKGFAYSARARLRPSLVWVRAFHSTYNPVLAIDVLARISKRFDAARLTMVGPDKDGTLAVVERRARELGVSHRLSIVGRAPRERVAAYLADADIFINTTDVDNTPLSVLEAMSSGLCVVSTNVGGLPYLLRHEHDALLVPPRDARAMSAAIERLLDDPDLAARLSRGACARAAEHDWDTVLLRWTQTLDEVVARG